MNPEADTTRSVDEQVVATKLVRLLTTSSRDLFLVYSDLRELRAEALQSKAREVAKRLDLFSNATLHEEPELWQR